MDISIGTSNIQPYGNSGGTQLALKNNDTTKASPSGIKSPPAQDDATAVPPSNQAYAPDAIVDMLEQRKALNADQLQKVVERMDEFVHSMDKNVSFRLDKATGRNVITIYQAQTGDVIKQIPDEEMLEVLKRLADASSGLFVKEVV